MTENLEIQIIIVEQVTNQFISNPELDIEQDLGNYGYIDRFCLVNLEMCDVICHFSDLHYIMPLTLEDLILFKVYCHLALRLWLKTCMICKLDKKHFVYVHTWWNIWFHNPRLPIHWAVGGGHIEVVIELLKHNKAQTINAQDDEG